MDEADRDILIRRYLLGDVSEEQMDLIEQRILTDAEYKDWVLMVEGELIDDYAGNALSESDREKFVRRFVSNPNQLLEIEVATALNEFAQGKAGAAAASATVQPLPAIARQPARRHGALELLRRYRRPLLACGLALIVMAGLVGAWKINERRLRERLAEEQRQRAEARELAELNSQPGSGPEMPHTRALSSSTLQTMLTPSAPLSAPPERAKFARVLISNGIDLVRFRLKLSDDAYQDYQAVFRTADGRELFTLDLKPVNVNGERSVVVTVPARLLADGDYRIQLKGLSPGVSPNELSDYYFRVSHQ